jgi:hypothetical protein
VQDTVIIKSHYKIILLLDLAFSHINYFMMRNPIEEPNELEKISFNA